MVFLDGGLNEFYIMRWPWAFGTHGQSAMIWKWNTPWSLIALQELHGVMLGVEGDVQEVQQIPASKRPLQFICSGEPVCSPADPIGPQLGVLFQK